jgi:putative DNA primase/helicase
MDVPRQCVFAGTANEDEYLPDPTGGRRFWPVTCTGPVDVQGLYSICEQLWAEAVVRYREGENWWLHEPEPVAEASDEQADRQSGDVWDEIIGQYLKNPAVATSGTTIPEIQWRPV